MSDELSGTVALVTGSSSGIGEATARALAAHGAAVALLARRKDRLERLAEEIESDGGRALVLPTDVTDADQARAAVQQTVADLGRLDIVVNNAGVMLLGPMDEAPLEEWQRMVSLNLGGLLNITHAAIPHLLAAADAAPRRVADLVNVSSVAGRVARANAAVYDLTKFGVGGFSESARQEFARRHLRVSVVEPGVVRTELTDHIRDGVREAARERLGSIEGLEPEDVADAIAYIVTRPRRVALNEVLIRPTEQDW
ncbi:MAG: Short-chain alcohol dehydrogenase [Actinobacteria bacterium]|nr:Short-chain alcohol dehydrogenase [Actinomycetota bacterium]